MITKKGLGLIDSQDAVYGNIAYDLASLIDDVRFKTDKKIKNFIFNEFIKKNKHLDPKRFKNDFEILLYSLKNLHLRIHSEKYIEQMQVLFVTWYNFAFLFQ